MYVFYKKMSATQGYIEAIYEDHLISEAVKAEGLQVAHVPEIPAGKVGMINLETLEISVVPAPDQESMFELKNRLDVAEAKLATADEQYQKLVQTDASLEDLKAAKDAQLEYFCNQEIAKGFMSASTGYKIGFAPKDEKNIQSQVILFLADPSKTECQWKTEDVGVKTLTRAEFMNLLPEGEQHTRANVGKLWYLRSLVQAATTKEAVDSVGW